MFLIQSLDAYVIKIAHRGASGYALENTLEAFEKAIAMGCDGIELDVRRCASGELVVVHDESIDRISNETGLVENLTLTQLKNATLKNGESIVTLQEALEYINGRVFTDIELKVCGVAHDIVEMINNLIARGFNHSHFIVSSFIHEELAKVKTLNENVHIMPLFVAELVDCVGYTKNLKASYVGMAKEFLSQKLVKDIHNNGLRIFVYTVNEPVLIDKMKNLGIDGIMSDYPDLI